MDLVEVSHNYSQTPFIWPGYENDVTADTFWPNAPYCMNYDCRYAGDGARRCRGVLFRCALCSIIACKKCKEETGHDYICEDKLKYHRVNCVT